MLGADAGDAGAQAHAEELLARSGLSPPVRSR